MTRYEVKVANFWARPDRNGPVPSHAPHLGPCWIWPGFKDRDGYGRCFRLGVSQPHRLAYLLTHGPMPAGYVPDHLCRNRACVNPAHLEAVTPRENTLRGMGISARNARKTHCQRGHPFDERNTRITRAGRGRRAGRTYRICRTCSNEDARRYRARKNGSALLSPIEVEGK